MSFACAQNDQLNVMSHKLIADLGYQIQTFLINQPGDQAKDGNIFHGQTHFALEAILIGLFSVRISISLVNALIRGWVKFMIIDAIDDPIQIFRAAAQHPIHAFAEFRSLDLLRIGAAHGADHIRIDDAGLHVAKLLVKLHPLRREIFLA